MKIRDNSIDTNDAEKHGQNYAASQSVIMEKISHHPRSNPHLHFKSGEFEERLRHERSSSKNGASRLP